MNRYFLTSFDRVVSPSVTVTLCIVFAAIYAEPVLAWTGITPLQYGSYAYGVSGDGSTVVGYGYPAGYSSKAMVWKDGVATTPAVQGGFAWATNYDGSISVGGQYRWSSVEGTQALSSPSPIPSNDFRVQATGLSDDGSVTVGYDQLLGLETGARAIRWSSATGATFLTNPPDAHSSMAQGVSGDGRVVVGGVRFYPNYRAFKWDEAGNPTALGLLPTGSMSYAYGVNHDGTVIVGQASTALGREGFRWTASGGMKGLGPVGGYEAVGGYSHSAAYATSEYGDFVVGNSYDPSSNRGTAWIWTPDDGLSQLDTYLTAAGINMTGWSKLEQANGISYDGQTIAGMGIYNGIGTAYVAQVPPWSLTQSSGVVFQSAVGAPVLRGSRPAEKTGAGSLVLDLASSFRGQMTVKEGSLVLGVSGALPNSSIVIKTNASLGLRDQLAATVKSVDLTQGGTIDVADGTLTIKEGKDAFSIRSLLLAGKGDGSWSMSGGITSSAVASDVQQGRSRALGWSVNPDKSVTVAFSAPGDGNLDGQVDILDVAYFVSGKKFNTGLNATWRDGDFNYDGYVDMLDVADFVSAGLYDIGLYNAPAGTIAAVPEPSTLVLVGVGAGVAWLLAKQRKQAA